MTTYLQAPVLDPRLPAYLPQRVLCKVGQGEGRHLHQIQPAEVELVAAAAAAAAAQSGRLEGPARAVIADIDVAKDHQGLQHGDQDGHHCDVPVKGEMMMRDI